MESKPKKQGQEELHQQELEKVNGGMLPIIHDIPDDDRQDGDNGGGSTGGW